MKTILYTISTLQRSGPSLVLYNIIKNLDRRRYNPVVLTLSTEREISIKQDFENLGVKVISLCLSRWQGLLLGRIKFHRVLRYIKPAIIHAQGFRDMCLVAGSKGSYKKIVTVHCDFREDYPLKYGKILGTLMILRQWRALSHFEQRVCVSHMLADLLNQNKYALPFMAIDNGVDTEKFFPVRDKMALRRQLCLPENKTIFIWAGSFIPCKDPMTLVRAIKELPQQEAFFVFCGARGKLLEDCKRELIGYTNVLFVGYVDNIREYMQAADFYISSSLSEGFHLTVYESLACGLSVILSDLPIYDVLKGKNCVRFFPARDSSSLCLLLQQGLMRPMPESSTGAVSLVNANYSAAGMSQAYQQIYEEAEQ